MLEILTSRESRVSSNRGAAFEVSGLEYDAD